MSSVPSPGLFRTKIIALPFSPAMLVYSMTWAPSVEKPLELTLPAVPHCTFKKSKYFVIRDSCDRYVGINGIYVYTSTAIENYLPIGKS